MLSTMGTNYNEKLKRGNTSRDEIHKLFGQSISEEAYSSPLSAKDIPATTPCCPYSHCTENDSQPQQMREIVGFEVFKIKGFVRTTQGLHGFTAFHAFMVDIIFFGIPEIGFTPGVVHEWNKEQKIEKNMTIWYGTNNTFEGGEIRYSETNELITLIPECIHHDFSKKTEM